MNQFYMTIANAAGPDIADKEYDTAFNTLAKHFTDVRPDRIDMFLDSRCGKLIAEMVLVGYSVAVQLEACPNCMERWFRRITQ